MRVRPYDWWRRRTTDAPVGVGKRECGCVLGSSFRPFGRARPTPVVLRELLLEDLPTLTLLWLRRAERERDCHLRCLQGESRHHLLIHFRA
jgi:hypothetical protein